MSTEPVKTGTLGDVRCIVEGSHGPLVRRKVLVFRRLEPGDVRTPGSHTLPHSPYLEAKLVEVALSKSLHEDMIRVSAKRAATLTADRSLLHTFDIPGMVLGAAGGGIAGSFLGYMPNHLRPALWALFGLGVALGIVTRLLRRRAEEEAAARWAAMPEHKEHERIARELSEGWLRFSALVTRELGFHTELRVGEGSSEPQRLCSIDPRGFMAVPPTFDPEDWLPTEGGGVRYEEVDVMGELVTRGLEGVDDVPTEASPSPAPRSTEPEPVEPPAAREEPAEQPAPSPTTPAGTTEAAADASPSEDGTPLREA